jgi:hypothetical protein
MFSFGMQDGVLIKSSHHGCQLPNKDVQICNFVIAPEQGIS